MLERLQQITYNQSPKSLYKWSPTIGSVAFFLFFSQTLSIQFKLVEGVDLLIYVRWEKILSNYLNF